MYQHWKLGEKVPEKKTQWPNPRRNCPRRNCCRRKNILPSSNLVNSRMGRGLKKFWCTWAASSLKQFGHQKSSFSKVSCNYNLYFNLKPRSFDNFNAALCSKAKIEQMAVEKLLSFDIYTNEVEQLLVLLTTPFETDAVSRKSRSS